MIILCHRNKISHKENKTKESKYDGREVQLTNALSLCPCVGSALVTSLTWTHMNGFVHDSLSIPRGALGSFKLHSVETCSMNFQVMNNRPCYFH